MNRTRRPSRVILLPALCLAGCLLPGGVAPARAHGGSPLVALLTDYGTEDQYVGVIKGVILSGCDDARIVDITHEVPAYDIRTAARLLYLAAREFPATTVVLAVVDPGVGTARRPIALETRTGMRFVAPDNGILTLVCDSLGVASARVISNPAYMATSHPISSTFHGRDIFAPAAAYLACGTPIELLGPAAGDIVHLDFPAPRADSTGILGEVERTDIYGNVLTNITREHLEAMGAAPGDTLRIRVGKQEWRFPWLRTYGDVAVGSRVALIASAGELELALNQRSLAALAGAEPGMKIEVRRPRAK